MKDHYKTLGINKNASENDIKKAYRTLAKKYHPDKNKAGNAEEKFKEIAAAYQTLEDKDKRRVYDNIRGAEEEKAKQTRNTYTSSHSNTSKNSGNRGNTSSFSGSHSNTSNTNTDAGSSSHNGANFTNYTFTSSKGFEEKENKKGKKKSKRKDKKYSPRQSYSYERPKPDWNNDWNGTAHMNGSNRPDTYSFKFRVFEDFQNENDSFEEFNDFFDDPLFSDFSGSFRKPFVFTQFGPAQNEAGGKSSEPTDEELMYDWSKPPWKQRKQKDDFGIGIDYNISDKSESDSNSEDELYGMYLNLVKYKVK